MSCRLALVGTDSPIGELVVELLAEAELPITELISLAVDPFEVPAVSFNKRTIQPRALAGFDFANIDLVIFADSQNLLGDYAAAAQAAGARVIAAGLNSQIPPGTPLVVPEVNPQQLQQLEPGSLVANPDPASIFLALVLAPMAAEFPLREVTVCCHLPAISQGQPGVEELVGQTARLLNGLKAEHRVFPQQTAFNLLAETAALDEDGYSYDEQALISQTQAILNDTEVVIYPTIVQVPVFYAQSMAVSVVAETAVDVQRLRNLLKRAPGLRLHDTAKPGPTAVKEATGDNRLFVGRVRQFPQDQQQISLWCVGDGLRKGAALNAVQIAEILIKSYL